MKRTSKPFAAVASTTGQVLDTDSDFIFTDEKVLHVTSSVNMQKDRVCVPCNVNKRELIAERLLRCRPTFYPRDAMLARVIAIVTCLSVWHEPVLCQNEASWFLHHLVAPWFQFFWDAKFHPDILRSSPERRPQTREGWVKSAVFYL